ncbi:MAG: glutamate racemase [Planctomycetota bacterium]|nr:glutamate racemase [Planctomycetota bacterium]
MENRKKRPIAVFDSGIGGLTVLSEIRSHLPAEDLIYFGDTARVPYGTKSPTIISRYAVEVGRFLNRFEPKVFVVACNSMSSVALPVLDGAFRLPLVDVIYPGAYAAVEFSSTGRIGVIATQATIKSNAYQHAVRARAPHAEVFGMACPLLVPAIEEGRGSDDHIVRECLAEYVSPLIEQDIDTLILGCTHYPVISDGISSVVGEDVKLVDSAKETAHRTRDLLQSLGLLREGSKPGIMRCYVSDNTEGVAVQGKLFLGSDMPSVELVHPEQFYE